MSFLDQLAFGPGGDKKAWARILLIAVAVLALAGGLLYTLVSGDYAYLRASVLTGAPTGGYNTVGQRLAALALKKNGHLKVVTTAGSVENIARLAGEKGRCVPAFAFVQDGIPVPADAGLETLGRLPSPESLFLFARRGRAINTFNDLKGARIGIGPEGSGTAYLVQQLMENSDLSGLGLKPSNHNLEEQAGLVRDGQLDLAASVMNEKAELVRTLVNKYDLEIVAPADIEGLISRHKWMHIGRHPGGLLRRREAHPGDRQAGGAGRHARHDQRVRAPRRAGRLSHAARRGVSKFRSWESAARGEIPGQRAARGRSARVLRQRPA